MERNTEAVKVNAASEVAVVRLLADIFNGIAYMDPEVVKKNIELACDGGFDRKDRSIRAELANYLLARGSLMVMGLVSNAEFRSMVFDAVSMEKALEDEDEDFVAEARADMSRGVKSGPSKGNFVIDLSKYDDRVYKSICTRLSASMERAAEFESEIDSLARQMTDDDRGVVGYIVSNWMYLVRAFSRNPVFASCVKSTFREVQASLALEF